MMDLKYCDFRLEQTTFVLIIICNPIKIHASVIQFPFRFACYLFVKMGVLVHMLSSIE